MLLNTRDIQLMNAFESITHARTLDCFQMDDTIVFLVKEGHLGRAIGRGGETINRARKKFGKRLMVFEDSDNPRRFIINVCKPLKASPNIGDEIRIDVLRSQRDEISGRQIRILKELIRRKLNVSKVNFVFT